MTAFADRRPRTLAAAARLATVVAVAIAVRSDATLPQQALGLLAAALLIGAGIHADHRDRNAPVGCTNCGNAGIRWVWINSWDDHDEAHCDACHDPDITVDGSQCVDLGIERPWTGPELDRWVHAWLSERDRRAADR